MSEIEVWCNHRSEDVAEVTLKDEHGQNFIYIGSAYRKRISFQNEKGEQLCEPWELTIKGFGSTDDICRLVKLGIENGIEMRIRERTWEPKATW